MCDASILTADWLNGRSTISKTVQIARNNSTDIDGVMFDLHHLFSEIFLRHYAIRSNWRRIHKNHYFFNLAIPLFDRSWLEQTNSSAKFHERFVNVCNINLTLSGSILNRFNCFRRKKMHDLVSSVYVTQPQKAAN